MKYRTRINNLYNHILLNDNFSTPYFIFYDNECYYVYKTKNDFKQAFKTEYEALKYIDTKCDSPLIINLIFK